MQVAVGDRDGARLSAGAAGVHGGQDVGRAADVDVRVGAASVLHAPVARRVHHDHRAALARRVERLPLTVLQQRRRRRRRRRTRLCMHR